MSGVWVDDAAVGLRRTLGPVAWFVLEALLLTADARRRPDGTVIVPASARGLAQVVSLNKDTVARALAALADAELVRAVGQARDGGRFAAGGYRVDVPVGVQRLDPAATIAPRSPESDRGGADQPAAPQAGQFPPSDSP